MTARRLIEFDLDAPMLGRSERRAFRLQSRFLTANVERRLSPLTNDEGIWKVLIEIVPVAVKKTPRVLLGVLAIEVVGDASTYLKSRPGERERTALNWLSLGVHSGFAQYGWPTDEFDRAVASAISENYRNVWTWKKGFLNEARTLSVDIVVEHDDSEARIVAVFRRKGSNELSSTVLCSKPPTEFEFSPCLGRLAWLDNETIQLTSRSGSESWVASSATLH